LEIRAAVEPYDYKTYAIRKSVFSTWLEETRELVAGAAVIAIRTAGHGASVSERLSAKR
jgi:hypothetical protein